MAQYGEVREESIGALEKLIRQFIFPPRLEKLIESRTKSLKGKIICRSSGRNEDSFERNLAGQFISPRKDDERLVVQSVKQIFEHALQKIWVEQNRGELKIEGVPNLLSVEEGFGVLIEPFLEFDASGTAMTNLYGCTTIEAVIGDAETAVKSMHANISQFLFRKGSQEFEYHPSFLSRPHNFRLKGTECSVEEDVGALLETIKTYPQVNGRFSPINPEQAKEINRVANALEAKIGVPLDIEWGFLDGKLYIVQIRPIIGDFTRPLAGKSQQLMEKESIAKTPIALGHTSSEGITGKVVLIGGVANEETIEELEREINGPYIRLQPDVASKVLERTTKAKVLIDVDQGSRQAHSVNLITNRIGAGEFVYANGPVLREGLEKSLTFVPHPTLRGVWISLEDVTYFCGGLRGEFYATGEKSKIDYGAMNDRQRVITYFHNRVKDIWPKGVSDFPTHGYAEVMHILENTIFDDKMEEMDGLLIHPLVYEEDTGISDNEKFNHLIWGAKGKVTAEDFKAIQPKIALLEEAISYPLHPHSWESVWMGRFRNVLFLKKAEALWDKKTQADSEKKRMDLGEKQKLPHEYKAVIYDPVQQEIAEARPPQKPERPGKLRVLFIDDDKEMQEGNKRLLMKYMGTTEYDFFFATNYAEANEIIDTYGADVVFLDWYVPSDDAEIKRFDPKITNIPNIVIDTGMMFDLKDKVRERFGDRFADRAIINTGLRLGIIKCRGLIRNVRQKQLDEWYAKHPEATQKTGDEEAIFIINSSFQEAKDLEELIKAKTGDMRKVVIIGSLWELERELKNYKPSLVITDSELDGGYSIDSITNLIQAKNPDAQFIVASEYAAILLDNVRTAPNILRVIEKPFYFRSVLEAM